MRSAVELIDDLEDLVIPLLGRRVRGQQPSDSEVHLGARCLRDQGICCFLYAVVDESVGSLRANDESRADGFPNLSMYFLDRVLRDDLQEAKLGAVAEACELQ